jgi:hypothetical protein
LLILRRERKKLGEACVKAFRMLAAAAALIGVTQAASAADLLCGDRRGDRERASQRSAHHCRRGPRRRRRARERQRLSRLEERADQGLQHEMGIQKTRIDIKNYADPSLVRAAAARLK